MLFVKRQTDLEARVCNQRSVISSMDCTNHRRALLTEVMTLCERKTLTFLWLVLDKNGRIIYGQVIVPLSFLNDPNHAMNNEYLISNTQTTAEYVQLNILYSCEMLRIVFSFNDNF